MNENMKTKKLFSTLVAFTLIASLLSISGCSLFGSSEGSSSEGSATVVEERKGASREARACMEAIDAIGEVTLQSEEQIAAAEALYAELSENDKADVVNYDVLAAARDAYNQLIVEDYAAKYLVNAKGAFVQPEAVTVNAVYAKNEDGLYYITYDVTYTDLLGNEVTACYGNVAPIALDDEALAAVAASAPMASLIGSSYWAPSEKAVDGQALNAEAIAEAFAASL